VVVGVVALLVACANAACSSTCPTLPLTQVDIDVNFEENTFQPGAADPQFTATGADSNILCKLHTAQVDDCKRACQGLCDCTLIAYGSGPSGANPMDTCVLFHNDATPAPAHPPIFETPAEMYYSDVAEGEYSTWIYTRPETHDPEPVIEFSVSPLAGSDLYYKEEITITATLKPGTPTKDVAILFAINSVDPSVHILRKEDYGASFPATNLAKISRGATSGSWTIKNKLAKPKEGPITVKVSVVFIANAKHYKRHPHDELPDEDESFTFIFHGGNR